MALAAVSSTGTAGSLGVASAKGTIGTSSSGADLGIQPVVAVGAPTSSPTLGVAEGSVPKTALEGAAVDADGVAPMTETEAVTLADAEGESEPLSLGGALVARGADLLASCNPFAEGGMEHALDQFLEELGGWDAGLPDLGGGRNIMVPGLASAVVALTVAEAVRRRFQTDDDKSESHAAHFPGLPSRRLRWGLED